jgi:hypothetical protein
MTQVGSTRLKHGARGATRARPRFIAEHAMVAIGKDRYFLSTDGLLISA